jgi:hypothetical protein
VDVDPAFAEALVWRTLAASEAAASSPVMDRHHRQAAAAYALPAGAREAAFHRLAVDEFAELGLAGPVLDALFERSTLLARTRRVLIGEAAGRAGEGVTCDGSVVGVRLHARRFDRPERLRAWCRHAFGHAEDTLDPSFGFVPGWDAQPGSSAAAERLHALWDISIDGRTAASDQAAVTAGHRTLVGRLCPGLPATAVVDLVDRLWDGPRPTFEQLRSWAAEPGELARELGVPEVVVTPVPGPLPPGRCPLCGFPSHDLRIPEPAIGRAVAVEFPAWEPGHGLCARCSDRYRFAAWSSASAGVVQ